MNKINNSNISKNRIIFDKEKNSKFQLSKNKNLKNIDSKNRMNLIKPKISTRIKYNEINYNNNKNLFYIKTNINSPNISSFLKNKDPLKIKNSNIKNNNHISRSFENRKYKKLKNKTSEISRVSSTKYNKESIIKYQDLYKTDKNKIERNYFWKADKQNNKMNNFKVKFIKKDNNKINEIYNNSFLYGKKINKGLEKKKEK